MFIESSPILVSVLVEELSRSVVLAQVGNQAFYPMDRPRLACSGGLRTGKRRRMAHHYGDMVVLQGLVADMRYRRVKR
jgi:hypothetical protein